MDFCIQLAPYMLDKTYGADHLYNDILDQAILADKIGFESVSITEHHLINILMMPAPLQFAVKIAAHTEKIKILTSIAVLPIHDMLTYAGEVVVADAFCNGRLLLGVGRGAYKFEIERLGVPMDETQARFNEALEVLQMLLSEEEVSWDGDYYKFDPITIMPRPVTPNGPQMMMAVLNPEGVYYCTKRGFHIQTTPLSGNHQLLIDQVSGFTRAKEEMGDDGAHLTLSLSRVGLPAHNNKDRSRMIEAAESYYARFDNVFTGPGIVTNGMIDPLPRDQSIEDLAESLLIGSPAEIVDKLGPYQELGVNRMIISPNFGLENNEILDGLQSLAEDVMPHFLPEKSSADKAAE